LLGQLNSYISLSAVQAVAITSYNVGYTKSFMLLTITCNNLPGHLTNRVSLIHLLHSTYTIYLKIKWVWIMIHSIIKSVP